jgi:hypothetical protein
MNDDLWGDKGTKGTGGYWIDIDPAPPDACGQPNLASVSVEVNGWIENEVQRKPAYKVSSTQVDWKPFDVPLHREVDIKATGQIQPWAESADITGPEGRPRDGRADSYPLWQPQFPVRALIGRFCRNDECGQPFLVGSGKRVCASGDTLELAINHLAMIRDPANEDYRGHLRGAFYFELSAGAACR